MTQNYTNFVYWELGHRQEVMIIHNDHAHRAILQLRLVDNTTATSTHSLARALAQHGHTYMEQQSRIDFKLRNKSNSTGVDKPESDGEI